MSEKGWTYDNNYDWVLQKTVRVYICSFLIEKGEPQLYRYDFKDLSISFQTSLRQNPDKIHSIISRIQTDKEPQEKEKGFLVENAHTEELEDDLDDLVPEDLSISIQTNEFFPSKETFIPVESPKTLRRSFLTFKEARDFTTEANEYPIGMDQMVQSQVLLQKGKSLEKEKTSLDDYVGVDGSLLIKTISLKIPDTKSNPKNRATIKNVVYSGEESYFENKTFKNRQ